jgi:hypothetical protein
MKSFLKFFIEMKCRHAEFWKDSTKATAVVDFIKTLVKGSSQIVSEIFNMVGFKSLLYMFLEACNHMFIMIYEGLLSCKDDSEDRV